MLPAPRSQAGWGYSRSVSDTITVDNFFKIHMQLRCSVSIIKHRCLCFWNRNYGQLCVSEFTMSWLLGFCLRWTDVAVPEGSSASKMTEHSPVCVQTGSPLVLRKLFGWGLWASRQILRRSFIIGSRFPWTTSEFCIINPWIRQNWSVLIYSEWRDEENRDPAQSDELPPSHFLLLDLWLLPETWKEQEVCPQ